MVFTHFRSLVLQKLHFPFQGVDDTIFEPECSQQLPTAPPQLRFGLLNVRILHETGGHDRLIQAHIGLLCPGDRLGEGGVEHDPVVDGEVGEGVQQTLQLLPAPRGGQLGGGGGGGGGG